MPAPAPAEDRVASARLKAEPDLRAVCQRAGLRYPPHELFLRAFKREASLEVWGREGHEPFRLLLTFPVLSSPGQLGPKRREGDRQVPEGFYAIDLFNPLSNFHLSMRINYPNAADRLLSDRDAPGSDIYIHGGNGSVGCLPLGDENIERLYLIAWDTHRAGQAAIPIHLFPARMAGSDWRSVAEENIARERGLAAFWATLQPGFDAFEKTRRVPTVEVDANGRYVFNARTTD